jgi:hypothetical protein
MNFANADTLARIIMKMRRSETARARGVVRSHSADPKTWRTCSKPLQPGTQLSGWKKRLDAGRRPGLVVIANRTNFASVNNEVSPLFGLTPGFTTFNVHGIRPGTALAGGGTGTSSTPLAFTSALPNRQIQFGLRFTF